MKKTAILICFLAIGAFAANAQDDTRTQSPSKTQDATKSSDAVNEQSPSNSPDVSKSGNISTSEGTMSNSNSKSLHNGTKLQISDLPKVVSENISAQHKGWTPQEVYKIDNQGSTAYEVVVRKNSDEMNLVYDATGNLLRTEQRSSLGSGSATPQPETK
jgi:hypothetical protein